MQPIAHLYAIFHLNLAFSSVPKHRRSHVISQCYWPLLKLARDEQIALGLEIAAFTLEEIQHLDHDWIEAFRTLLADGQCELIASGDTQLIGPLVPAQVNRWNIELGLQSYERLLHVRPRLAYINEQAVSASLLDLYLDAGFEGIVMEWDNPRMLHPHWGDAPLCRPARARTASGGSIPVLWNWCIAFQKFQRYAHGDLVLEDYLDFVEEEVASGIRALAIYGNDAEVFDFRPARYREEAPWRGHEWGRIFSVFRALSHRYAFALPSDAIGRHLGDDPPLELTTSEYPVVVKKQRKYNLTRWAVTGRDDLWLNTRCYREYQRLRDSDAQLGIAQRRQLCRLWASDYRTHLEAGRYQALLKELPTADLPEDCVARVVPGPLPSLPGWSFSWDPARRWLTLQNTHMLLILNMRRGGAIARLAFHGGDPLVGTLEHGRFRNIELGADFYSCHTLVELPGERRRITDLEPARWQVKASENIAGGVCAICEVDTSLGVVRKTYQLDPAGRLGCAWDFPDWSRPEGICRIGWLTLKNREAGAPVTLATHHGGVEPEVVLIERDVDHGRAVSSLVSANSALGGTEGQLWLAAGGRGVTVKWNPGQCAAIPMLFNRTVGTERLTRVFFSLVEMDDTLKAGGRLLPFSFTLAPWDASQGACESMS